jgi:hypothetical protein
MSEQSVENTIIVANEFGSDDESGLSNNETNSNKRKRNFDDVFDLSVTEYLKKSQFELADHVTRSAFFKLYSDSDERFAFAQQLQRFYEKHVTILNEIERKFPMNRADNLFKQSREYREDKFNKVKQGATINLNRIERLMYNLDDSDIQTNEEESAVKEVVVKQQSIVNGDGSGGNKKRKYKK